MNRGCGHSTGDDQRLGTQYRDDQRLQTVQEMTRDCVHRTGDDQRMRTVQEMTRDCGQYRR
ncbi:unnamed protein product [Staurois parvus]|uniref:Uncharacterized protein n=1 Tax=Staurois parvus TaxID=386267 RepID=A0ABN9FP50_9NEOB|nr:unnamed protein product [Staurois parvus]